MSTTTSPTRRVAVPSRYRLIVMILALFGLLTLPANGNADPRAVAGAVAGDAPRIDLRVLVLDDGSPAVRAITAALRDAGTPVTTVDLDAPDRPRVDADFLADTDPGDRPRAHFQGVVAPSEAPAQLGADETRALAAYRARFDIPQVDAHADPGPEVGLDRAEDAGAVGALDGVTAEVTPAGAAGPFGYLDGEVPFEDADPEVTESHVALARPLTDPPPGASFTTYLRAEIPGTDTHGSLVGEYVHDGGLRDLVVTFTYNEHQRQFHLLSRGIVDWLTDGVRLGQSRYYLSVHVDDVLAANDRWSVEDDCTTGEAGCPADPEDHPLIRATAEDAEFLRDWQQEHGLYLDLAFNAGLGESWREEHGGEDPLTDQLLADRDAYRWLNHTYDHLFLGCRQDFSVSPWECVTDDSGEVVWTGEETIVEQITGNLDWAEAHDVTLDATELVTGEHSGLAAPPQQPRDNPNLAPALAETGVAWVGSDNSVENRQRAVGEALTVPRHPMDVYYNTATEAEAVDLYNWIHTSRADGGSGTCEATDSCLPEPLDPATGFAEYVVPTEADAVVDHVLAGDPRPHYVHQSNLAEDRLVYPVLEEALASLEELLGDDTPLVNPTLREAGEELDRRLAWQRALAEDRVTGYRVGDTVTVTVEPADGDGGAAAVPAIPVTAPRGTTVLDGDGQAAPFASAYAGSRVGWATPGGDLTLTLALPGEATDSPS